jgi:predicted ester cyclase
MSTEKNKATLRRVYEEVFNKGNLAVIPELIDKNFVFDSPFGKYNGLDGFKQMITLTRAAFPDIQFKVDDMVAEGDKIAVRLSIRGTFKGKFGDYEPTGKQINVTAAYFYRFKDGKEMEVTPVDPQALGRALGILTPL